MSSQRGNIQRTRPQKYKNRTVFKNDLHDKTPLTKHLNTLCISHVCQKCKHILEWKIKYKKYKPIRNSKKCTKCDEKAVKHAYHIMCASCAQKLQVCPKCGKGKEIADAEEAMSAQAFLEFEAETNQTLKILNERHRRTFLRYMDKFKGQEPSGERNISLADLKKKLASLMAKGDDDDDELDDDDDVLDDDSDTDTDTDEENVRDDDADGGDEESDSPISN